VKTHAHGQVTAVGTQLNFQLFGDFPDPKKAFAGTLGHDFGMVWLRFQDPSLLRNSLQSSPLSRFFVVLRFHQIPSKAFGEERKLCWVPWKSTMP